MNESQVSPAAFLAWLFGDERDDKISISVFKPYKNSPAFSTTEEAAAYAEHLDGNGVEGVYFRLSTLPGGWTPLRPGARGEASESAWSYAIMADMDLQGPGHVATAYPETDEDLTYLLEKAGLPRPSAWINSGGGRYPIWKLSARVPAADMAPLSARWHEHLIGWAKHLGWKLDNTSDVARVFRMPGTHNRKPERGTDQPACVVTSINHLTYSFMELSSALATAPVAPAGNVKPAGPAPMAEGLPFAQPSQLSAEGAQRRNVTYTDTAAMEYLGRQEEVMKEKLWVGNVYRAYSGFLLQMLHFEQGFPWLNRDFMIGRIAAVVKEKMGWEELDEEDMERINRTFAKWDSGNVDDMWTAVRLAQVEPTEEVLDSWAPVDVSAVLSGEHQQVVPELGMRSDGIRILYPGKEHAVASEPECGKTWWVMLQVKNTLEEGGRVVYIDFEDDEGTIVGRLMGLGVAHELLGWDRFRYVRPDVSPPAGIMTKLCTFGENIARLVVLDGMTEGLGLMGLSALDQEAIVEWRKILVKPAMRLGVATLTTDHVVKAADNRGRYAIGAQHKLAGLNGVMFTMSVHRPFGRGLDGISKVYITKDRNGGLRVQGRQEEGRTEIGELHGVCSGGRNEWSFRPPAERNEESTSEPERYPGLDERLRRFVGPVLAYVAEHPGMSTASIKQNVTGQNVAVGRALQWLVDKKVIVTSVGAGGGRLHSFDSLFRAAMVDLENHVLDNLQRNGQFLSEE